MTSHHAEGAPWQRRALENDLCEQHQISSKRRTTSDLGQVTIFDFVHCREEATAERPARDVGAKRTRKRTRDAEPDGDTSAPSLLDFMAALSSKTETPSVEAARADEPEAPRAAGRASKPKSAVVEPIVSHRLAREPWVWRNALLASTSLSPGVKVVGVTALEFINRKTGVAFPGNDAIAPRCGMAEDTVRKHVAVLIRNGWLTAEKTKFRGSYDLRLTLPSNGLSGTPMPDSEGIQSGTTMPDNPAPSCRTNRHGDAAQSGTSSPTSHYIEPSTKPFTQPPTEPLRPSAFRDDGKIPKPDLNPFDLLAERVDELLTAKPIIENAIANYVAGIDISVAPNDDEIVGGGRSVSDARSCMISITRSFMRSFGYELLDRVKIDGQYPDLAFVSRCPENVLVEMVRRTRQRDLTAREVALVATAAGMKRRAAS